MSLWKAVPPPPLSGLGELEGRGGERGVAELPEVKALAPSPLLAGSTLSTISVGAPGLQWEDHWAILPSAHFFNY